VVNSSFRVGVGLHHPGHLADSVFFFFFSHAIMESASKNDLRFVVCHGKCQSVLFRVVGCLFLVCVDEMDLCCNLADVVANTVAKGFAGFTLYFIPVLEWCVLSVPVAISISVSVASKFSASVPRFVDDRGLWDDRRVLAPVHG
jgi:hypothetical protein